MILYIYKTVLLEYICDNYNYKYTLNIRKINIRIGIIEYYKRNLKLI